MYTVCIYPLVSTTQHYFETVSDLVPAGGDVEAAEDTSEDAPVIIILIVCIVGIFLLALNIGLILFFVRRRKKRMESKIQVSECRKKCVE